LFPEFLSLYLQDIKLAGGNWTFSEEYIVRVIMGLEPIV
jgi:hypothetical protein